jgi:hypothetical protein
MDILFKRLQQRSKRLSNNTDSNLQCACFFDQAQFRNARRIFEFFFHCFGTNDERLQTIAEFFLLLEDVKDVVGPEFAERLQASIELVKELPLRWHSPLLRKIKAQKAQLHRGRRSNRHCRALFLCSLSSLCSGKTIFGILFSSANR